ncbi:PIN domain nuclease [Streptomyces sp. A3M-1-3]|uniref:PIN domain nuclease n=1 Tax=Streptomyces sp. A3M-1-3 TaxID=2962044 RepID=UPI0020B8F3BA|nr:PIN domain nuclease [Streptomyces sp. A3M-1-3]MCP3817710.1 PIN domain nuclease [Streptomyces sp. A3M-1-3]
MEDPGGAGFLIDTSAAHRIMRPEPLAMWKSALTAGRIGMCAATEVEALYSAKSAAHYREMREAFGDLYAWHVVPEDAWLSVLEMQRLLVEAGCGRSAGLVDLLVAATAMHHRLTVLHYDRDFETVAEHIGLRTQWLAAPGSIH